MSEDRNITKPTPPAKPSLWDQALRAVKGENTTELIEQFTQEMTLVAEGLCEDQARLRKAVDGLIRQAENEHDQTARANAEVTALIDRQDKEIKQQLDALSRRLDALESSKQRTAARFPWLSGGLLDRVTLLASIVCGTWLVVTILQLFM